MKDTHKRNTLLFYCVLALAFAFSFGAIYQNLYVEKNFKQFTIEDEEPDAFDFYLHSNEFKK